MIAKTLSRLGIEVWKDIPEYEGFYQVSNLANVRSLDRIDERGRKLKGKIIRRKPLFPKNDHLISKIRLSNQRGLKKKT